MAVPLQILVLSDLSDDDQGDAVLLNRADGSVVSTSALLPNGGRGGILPSGIFAFGEQQVSGSKLAAVAIYTSALSLVTRVTSIPLATPLRWESPVIAWGTHTFYFMAAPIADPFSPTLYTISDTGVIGGTTWVFSGLSATPRAMNVSNDGTILYWTGANAGLALFRHDLANDLPLSNFLAGVANHSFGSDLFLTPDGDVVVPYQPGAAVNWELRRYSSSAVLQDSFDIGPNLWADDPELFSDVDPDNIWVRTFPDVDGFQSRFRLYVLATGAVLEDWTVTTLAGGGQVPVTCPSLLLRTTSQTQTFTIRRQRRFLLPSSPDNKFMQIPTIEILMRTGIGLTPDAWNSDANVPQGANPQVMTRISKDGGKTWSPERWISAGKIGEYLNRVRVLRATGNYRNAVFEVTVSDPVDWQFLAAMGDPVEGSS